MRTLREGICKEARETKDSVSIVSEPLFFLILFSGNTVNNATCEISKKKKKSIYTKNSIKIKENIREPTSSLKC